MTAAACLFLGVIVGCGQAADYGSAREHASIPPSPEEEAPPPDPPAEFRRLTLAPIPGAPDLVTALLDKSESFETRRRLVELYERAAYLGAARFFENSIRELGGQAPLLEKVRNPVAWSATERDLEERPLEVARRVSRLLSQSRYTEAVQAAQREIEENGSTLQVAVQWSYAVLWQAMASPDQVSPEALEVAIRVFLTSLEEKVPNAVEIDSKAKGYGHLARVFFRLGDTISSRAAAKLALEHLAVTDTSPEWDKFAAQRLQELLREIEKSSSDPE
ncbi:MAG TPA: hypothetical protein VNJ70_02000 [Thermoanaerobaculia bacterium]|nr:hypothetical protein [Thermoanaerobaculia bacterium]